VATNQPKTKRDVGGQGSDGQGKSKGQGNPPKNQPGKGSQGGGSKGKKDSGGNR
jgi:hypothetical protein